MPFCPKCRYEYLPTVSECPDCETRLVLSLPLEPEEPEGTETMESYDDWVPIARFTSTQYADLVLEALESKDIPALLSDHTGNFGRSGLGMSAYSPDTGAITLFVPQEFIHDASLEARIILGEDWDKAKLGDLKD
jgi:hypothetical protein